VVSVRRFSVRVIPHPAGPAVAKAGTGAAAVALRREARALAAMRHPGVVDLIDVGDDGSTVVVITRLAGVHTLHTTPATAPNVAVTRAGQLLATLAAIHARGLAHGAVDASHVVVGPAGAARWCSLGRSGPAAPAVRHAEVRMAAALATAGMASERPTTRNGRSLVGFATDVLGDDRLTAGELARALAALLIPAAGPAGRRRRAPLGSSAQPDRHLVGQQSASDGEHEVVAPPFDETVEYTSDLRWWER